MAKVLICARRERLPGLDTGERRGWLGYHIWLVMEPLRSEAEAVTAAY